MQKQLQNLELLQRQVSMVKVQHQLNRTRTTRFVQTPTKQVSSEKGSNEKGFNEKGSKEQANDEASKEKFFKRFDVLDR
jgi:hypothetical protein